MADPDDDEEDGDDGGGGKDTDAMQTVKWVKAESIRWLLGHSAIMSDGETWQSWTARS